MKKQVKKKELREKIVYLKEDVEDLTRIKDSLTRERDRYKIQLDALRNTLRTLGADLAEAEARFRMSRFRMSEALREAVKSGPAEAK